MYPFRDGDATATFPNHQQTVVEQINGLDNVYVSKAAESELEAYFLDKATFRGAEVEAFTCSSFDLIVQAVSVHVAPQPTVFA